MTFLDQIKDLYNKTFNGKLTTDHSEAEVLRALDKALEPVQTMTSDLQGVNNTIKEMQDKIAGLESRLDKGIEVSVNEAFEQRMNDIENKIPSLDEVNGRITELSETVAEKIVNKPVQNAGSQSPLKEINKFDQSVKELKVTFTKPTKQ